MFESLIKIIQGLPIFIWGIDTHDNITEVNHSWAEFSGETTKINVKDFWKTYVHPEDYQFVTNNYNVVKKEKTPFDIEYRLKTKNGSYKYILDKYKPLFDNKKKFQGYLGIGIDITDRRKQEEKLKALSYKDTLTGIYNRNFFEETLEILESQIERKLVTTPYTLFVIDVNDLKTINDGLGHDKGDILLKETANILTKSVRKTDHVFRIGGDEFTAIAYSCNENTARRIIGRIHSNIEEFNKKLKKPVYVSLSIGWVTSTDHKDTPKRLVRQADEYMYAYKNKNKERYKQEVENFIKKIS